MKVFLAGIIQGSLAEARIHDQDWRTPIKRILTEHRTDAEIYCHYSLHPNSITYEMPEIRATLADGFKQAAQCDLLIAYVPSASMGTAIEIYEAVRNNAIVLTISPMAPNWVLRAYSHRIFPDTEAFEQFIATGGLDDLIAQRK
ncbi:MAG: hypothetical protein QGH60_16575 [Phycisphaerae bacterium]|jgi:NAD-dependent SIR2 family protein deacetylase|nr:hypothetical protein [Phycisphaerae bacterium]